jgi:hypothetical protein
MIIFSTVTNHPVERDETRKSIVIDHQKLYDNLKGSPETKHRKRGPIIPAVGSLRGIDRIPGLSYKGITKDMDVGIGGQHHIEIREDLNVYMNDVMIACSPLKSDAGKKKTSAQRLTFCKAVIQSLISDDENLNSYAMFAPSKMIIALPGPVVSAIPEEITLPDVLNAYTHEAITGYPETAKTLESSMTNQNWNEIEEREMATIDIIRDIEEDMYSMGSNLDSISLENEYNRGEEVVLYDLIHPVQAHNPANITRSWFVPHLRLTITEEVYS